MKRVTVRGARLAVRDEGRGPAVVWMHGLTSDMEAEDDGAPLVAAPPAAGLRVVRYDARSHGSSSSAGDVRAHTWPELARDLLELADVLGIDDFVAAGSSMGTATALHAALLAPARVRGLVLTSPPTAWDTRPAQARQYRTVVDMLGEGLLEKYVEGRLALPPHPVLAEAGDAWRERRRARLLAVDPAALALALAGAAESDLPDRSALATVAAPALVLCWPDDPVHPATTAETLAATLPRATYEPAHSLREVLAWPDRIAAWCRALGS